MANELLDFVMGLVRDPEAAARYAADPSSAIADAHLTNVTSADVNNLIPMVSDSLSMAAPAVGTPGALDAFGAVEGGNVWTSGAATAAFDAFDTHLPEPAIAAVHDFGSVIDTSLPATADAGPAPMDFDLPHETSSVVDVAQFSDVIDDPASTLPAEDPSWDFGAAENHLQHGTDGDSGHAGFDIFS